MHHRPTWIAAALIAATAALSSSCVAAGTSTTAVGTTPLATAGTSVPSIAPSTSVPGPLPHGPFATKTTTLTLVDRSRATPAGAQTPERPERTLETVVYEPDAAGSFPLVVFSHGLGGDPGKFTKLLTAWSGAGFVVAAPAFPLTNDHTPGFGQNWTDLAQQPADVRFVIDDLLARNRDQASPLHDRILPDRIGAGGLSLGGATTYALVYHDCCRDDRIKATMVLSGGRLAVGAGDYVMDRPVPLLIMHGDKDVSMPYKLAVDAFAAVKGPAWFATLDDWTHSPPFEDTPSRMDGLAEKTTTDFWEGTLAGDPVALARVGADATVPGLSTVQTK